MARMRSLKPEFWADEELACQLTRDERMLYLGLWNQADEHARVRGNPSYIKGQVFPYDDDITPDIIEKMLGSLADLGKVRPYRVGVGSYLFLPNLGKHQRLETDKVPSRLPSPDEADLPAQGHSDESRPFPDSPESRANKSARDSDEPARGADLVALKHVAGGMEHVAGGMGAHGRAGPPKTMLANALLKEHVDLTSPTPGRETQKRTGDQIDLLLDDSNINPDEIREGLALLRSKPHLGPGALASLVDEVRRLRARPELEQRASPAVRREQERQEHARRALERAAIREANS